MSRLNPLVRERFKAKNPAYDTVYISYQHDKTYEIAGTKKKGRCEWIENITHAQYSLREARTAIWDYAEVQDGLPVKAIR